MGSLVHDLQSSIGALQANFEYLSQSARGRGRPVSSDLDECVHDTQTVFRQIVRGLHPLLPHGQQEAGDSAHGHNDGGELGEHGLTSRGS